MDVGYIVTGWVVGCGLLGIAWMVTSGRPQTPPPPPPEDEPLIVPPSWVSEAHR
jgi:hypothetical protein